MQTYFNYLKADLSKECFFASHVYEPTKSNLNPVESSPYVQRDDSLDAYVSVLTKEIHTSLKGPLPIFPKGKIVYVV